MLINFRSLRVAVLCSGRAPGLATLLHHPHRGQLFDIACVVSTASELEDYEHFAAAGVPVALRPIRRFAEEHGTTLRDQNARRAYDEVTADLLRRLQVDTVICLGYLYVLSDVMLTAFPKRILNIHDSDLTLMKGDGERRYVGLHSTFDAIAAGETETRSSVHFVTEKVDAGPVLLMSPAHPVAPFATAAAADGAWNVVKPYAYAHREWMMRDDWGALAVRTLEYIASGLCDGEIVDGADVLAWEADELVAVI